MTAKIAHAYISPEDYLERERNSPIKHEYTRGQIYAMAVASKAHTIIVGNIFTLLRNHLRGSACIPYMMDMKVRLETVNSYFYPDVTVTCDARDNASLTEDFIRYPRLVLEVLSPTTAAFDRGEKFADYRSIKTRLSWVLWRNCTLGYSFSVKNLAIKRRNHKDTKDTKRRRN
jgi:Uma2 family endonuclease